MYIATYLMYLGKCNLYGKVIEFRKQEQHSKNSERIINWLQDLIKNYVKIQNKAKQLEIGLLKVMKQR